MPFKKLTSCQLTEVWNGIERKALELRAASMIHNPVKVYRAMEDLDFLRMKLQNHFAAVAVEESQQKDA